MKRRVLIKRMFFLSTGTILLPSLFSSCAEDPQFNLDRLKLSRKQEQLLEILTETIIPKTDTPGAIDLGLPVFVAKMVNDCSSWEELTSFKNGMQHFQDLKIGNMHFEHLSAKERLGVLSGNHPDELNDFLKIIRERTIEAYTCSEYVMTELVPYKLVPGPFRGIIKI